MYKRVFKRKQQRNLDKWVTDRLARVNAKILAEQQAERETAKEINLMIAK